MRETALHAEVLTRCRRGEKASGEGELGGEAGAGGCWAKRGEVGGPGKY